jgi:hypothetical protein
VSDQARGLTKLRAELQLLEGSLQDSQRQAMTLGSRLNQTENKNNELISQNQVGACSSSVTHLQPHNAYAVCRPSIQALELRRTECAGPDGSRC